MCNLRGSRAGLGHRPELVLKNCETLAKSTHAMASSDPARGPLPTEATWADENAFASSVEDAEEDRQPTVGPTTFKVPIESENVVDEGDGSDPSAPSGQARSRTGHVGSEVSKSI